MNLKTRALIFVCFLCIGMQAQQLKFGKVSKEELEEKVYAKDSSAVAAYLYKHRNSFYQYYSGSGLQLITEIHERIKIYDKAGLDYATKTISLYKSGSTDEKFSSLKAITYNLENGKISESKLGKDGIFKSEYSKNINQVKLTLPNVKEGAVLEYKYRVTSPFVQSIDEFVLQEDIPIKRLNASMRILEYFKFNQRQKGFFMLNPKVEKTRDNQLGIDVIKTDFNLSDVPAMKQEKYVSNIDNYRSAAKFEIVSLEIPGSTYENFSKTWDDVVETIYDNPSFGGELKKGNYFEDDLNTALEGSTNDGERIASTMNFLRKNVKWNSSRGVYCDEGVKKAFKTKTGNSGDMNLMLIAMLKHAGIDAYPVLVSTRDNGIPLFPTLQGFNYVVVAAKIGDGYALMDATDPYSTPNVLPVRALNWYGRLISDTGKSISIDLMPKQKSAEVNMMNVTINDDGSINGKFRQQYTNHNALYFRQKYNRTTEESFLEELEKENSDIEISNYQLKNNENIGKPIVQSYEFYKEDMIDAVGGKLYFSPFFHIVTSENPFKLEKREYPVDFGYPWMDKFTINVKVPAGYKIESIPEPMALMLPEGMGSFKYNISENNGNISINAAVSINSAIIAPMQYDALKEFYRQMVEKETEKVVLSKI